MVIIANTKLGVKDTIPYIIGAEARPEPALALVKVLRTDTWLQSLIISTMSLQV